MGQNRGFWATNRARVFGQAEGESDFKQMCQLGEELQKSSREPTIAAAIVLEVSVVREDRM